MTRTVVFSNSEPLTYTYYNTQKYDAIIGNEQEQKPFPSIFLHLLTADSKGS